MSGLIYNREDLLKMDVNLISSCSLAHIRSVLADLRQTALLLSESQLNEANKGCAKPSSDENEVFEADYLAAFPKHGQSALALYGFGRNADEYEKQATRIALRVWQQQAARHKAEIAELVGASSEALEWLKAALECKDWEWDFDQRECAEFSVKQLATAIVKYEAKPAPAEKSLSCANRTAADDADLQSLMDRDRE